MTPPLKEATLPNGKKLFCLQKHDVAILHQEVQTYFDQGISVHQGSTIVDVGANIGLFMLEAYDRCQGKAQVYAFEPIPAVFAALAKNAERYGQSQDFKVFASGLSHQAGATTFTFYPNAPALSTAYPDEVGDLQMVKEATLNNIIHMDYVPWTLRLLGWLPLLLQSYVLDWALKAVLKTCQVPCPMTTLSQVISDQQIEQIDLLKVDVERSELDVFLGLQLADWDKIQQVVVDIHDIDARLDQLTGLFRQQGLNQITVAQPPTLTNSSIYTVYARRV
jgi:FkbM family methyltransferase